MRWRRGNGTFIPEGTAGEDAGLYLRPSHCEKREATKEGNTRRRESGRTIPHVSHIPKMQFPSTLWVSLTEKVLLEPEFER